MTMGFLSNKMSCVGTNLSRVNINSCLKILWIFDKTIFKIILDHDQFIRKVYYILCVYIYILHYYTCLHAIFRALNLNLIL